MIRLETHLGTTYISEDYFANLVGRAASECFGVAGLAASTPYQGLLNVFSNKELPDKGVKVHTTAGRLIIDLHIIVTFGVNVAAIVQSIIHKVRYTVEDATGMEVAKVNVFVDSMRAE